MLLSNEVEIILYIV